MSIALQNRVAELERRVSALESVIRQLADSKQLQSRPKLTLPEKKSA